MSTTPLLGAYLIVRNAEETIGDLLQSLVFKDKDAPLINNLAVDELVIVDTGSTDRTREIIEQFVGWEFPDENTKYGEKLPDSHAVTWESADGGEWDARIVLARMTWPDDFAAARNYAFSLGTAKWRMWLDADDVFPRSENLLPTIQALETRSPAANVIFMPYDYCPPEVLQDKPRVVRWADGWKWKGVIHEDLVRVDGQRVISYVRDLVVHHRPKDPQHGEKSLARNTKLLQSTQASALEAGDAHTAGIMSYYLGMYARNRGEMIEARTELDFAAATLAGSNLACYSLVELTRGELAAGDLQRALDAASRAIAQAPELPDGWGALGIVLTALKQYSRAVLVFDRLKSMPKAALEATRDRVWNDGIVWANAGVAYVRENDVVGAIDALKRIPDALAMHELVWMTYSRAASDAEKLVGLNALSTYVNYLIANNEPVKAVELLDTYAPSNVEALPVVSAMRKAITDKMQQLISWADYKRVYAAECNEVFDRDEEGVNVIRAQGRAQQALRWARTLSEDGPPINLYVIGIHGGWIEEDVLDANSRIIMTACDVNPNANTAIQRLSKKFPDRVHTHAVKAHHYDWIPTGKQASFDAVFCFEVIEHVPDDLSMVRTINKLLRQGGELLLSTPIAEYWVAPDASKRHHWHQHVRAYQPDQLWKLLHECGFEGDLYATDNRILHFAHVVKRHVAPRTNDLSQDLARAVTIWCPGAPEGFDAQTPTYGHCGGSEEAVIHLSHELAAMGAFDVTVYANVPDRAFKPHVSRSVLWRPLEELDPARLTGPVLVWRSPQSAAWLKTQNPKLRVLNWLHDVSYGAKPAQYATVDGTITLSKFHQSAISKNDRYHGPFLEGMNGIIPEEFAGLEVLARRPHRVIYASAPNRGLDLLLEIWPAVRAAVPDAQLEIYYGWEITEKMMRGNVNLRMQLEPLLLRLKQDIADLKTEGVTYFGGVSHQQLHRAYASAGVWAAPERDFEETFCISALKAQAAGALPVVWKSGALPEVVKEGFIAESKAEYQEKLIAALHAAANPQYDRSASKRWALDQTWVKAAARFTEFLTYQPQDIAIFAAFGRSFDETGLYQATGPQLGGSEEAVILTSEALALRGAHVTVYADLPHGAHRSAAGVYWMPLDAIRPSKGLNVVWRNTTLARDLVKQWKGSPVVFWAMDPSYDHPEALESVSRVIALSNTHRNLLGYAAQIIPNGLDLSELPPLSEQNDKGRHPEWVMWATSPDRGLEKMLDMWPSVRLEVPNAQLHIFYGLDAWLSIAKSGGDDAAYQRACGLLMRVKEMSLEGVVYHGGVSRSELLAWHVRCGTWAYPFHGFHETFCISGVKAAACGLQVVTWDQGVLPEVLESRGWFVPVTGNFGQTLIHAIQNPVSFADRKKIADHLREKYDVNLIAREWLQLAEELHQQHSQRVTAQSTDEEIKRVIELPDARGTPLPEWFTR